METKNDVTNPGADDPSSVKRSARSGQLRIFGMFSLLFWVLFILYCLYGWPDRRIDITMFICYSLTTFAGFYLACGNARWWARWLLVGLTILLITASNPGPGRFAGLAYFGVLAMISAGFTYASRMIISAFRRESSPRQRFTIFGLMIVTAITAVCLVALNLFPESERAPSALSIVLILVLLGFTLTAQCASAWYRTTRGALVVGFVALLLAIPVALGLHVMFHYVNKSPPDAGNVLIPIGTTVLFMWILLYPLWFGFHALGWTLIDPSWKFGPRYVPQPAAQVEVKEIDVLMSDDGNGS